MSKENEKELPKRDSLQLRLKKRKDLIKKTFLECVKKHNPESKFNTTIYFSGQGGKGFLCDAIGAFNSNDRNLFRETVAELKKDGTLNHIGGSVYALK